MADPSGYEVLAAIKRPAETSDYGTEATSITNQIPLVSENMKKLPVLVESDAVQGQAGRKDVQLSAYNPAGSITTELWYEGLEYLWFSALGFESPDEPATRTAAAFDQGGSPAPDTASSPDSFLHVFEPDENIHREGWLAGERDVSGAGDYVWTGADKKVRAVSLCLDKGVGSPSVNHWVDCMVDKFTIRGAHGKPIQIDWELVARSSSYDGSSASWALPNYGPPRPAFFTQAKFCLTAPGTALATELAIQSFEITFANNLKSDDYDTGGNDASVGIGYRTEPVRNGMRATSMKVKLGRMNASTVALDTTYFSQDAPCQAMLKLTGPDIDGSAYPYGYTFGFPLAKVVSANFPVSGAGVLTGDAEVVGYKPSSTNWGYTWVRSELGGVNRIKNNEFFVGLTNTRGSCFSRDRNTIYPLP